MTTLSVPLLLLVVALVAFIFAVIDWPAGRGTQLIALGLALMVLAQLIGVR